MTDFWRRKLLACLHDPATKCFDLGGHTDNAATLAPAAGSANEMMKAYNRPLLALLSPSSN